MAVINYPFHELDWDTKFFGVKMGEIILALDGGQADFSEEKWRNSLEAARKQNYHFLLCQFDTQHQEVATKLTGLGATMGDVLLTLRRELIQPVNSSEQTAQFQISQAVPENLPAICEIAANSFEYSRFFQDSHFDKRKVQQFYPDWISEAFMKFERVYILKEQHTVQGFITLQIKPEERLVTIRLIAVRSSKRGQGLGNMLVNWAIQYFTTQGFQVIQVGTQVNNYPAVRLYEKNGFLLKHATYRFHIWFDIKNNSQEKLAGKC